MNGLYLDYKSFPRVVTQVAGEISTQSTQATGARALMKVCRTSPDGLYLVQTLVRPYFTCTRDCRNTR